MAKVLLVYLHESKVGELCQKDDGRLSFSYEPGYLAQPTARPLSMALPLSAEPHGHKLCHAVFGGILPDGDIRERLARALGVSARNDFSLLAEIGGECAGALSLMPQAPDLQVAGKPGAKLSSQALEALFRKLPVQPLLLGEGVRLSLAGAQNKLALAGRLDDFHLPSLDVPSTHILKIAPEGYPGLLENELFCMRLAAQVGIPAAKVSLGRAGAVPYLCVERFDREQGPGPRRRLHQEDLCQALGLPPENKYQVEGGPSFAAMVALIRQHSLRPAADLAVLLKLAYYNYLIGNADAHGKNFSLLLTDQGPLLAPAYDLLCTAVYPGLQAKMAMKIGDEYDPARVGRRQWEKLAQQCGFKESYVLEGLQAMGVQLESALPLAVQNLEAEVGAHEVFGQIIAVFQRRFGGG